MERLEKITSGEGLYQYVIYQIFFGGIDLYGRGFNSKWRALPSRPRRETISKLQEIGHSKLDKYISDKNRIPLLARFYALDGIDCIIMKIDNQKYQII